MSIPISVPAPKPPAERRAVYLDAGHYRRRVIGIQEQIGPQGYDGLLVLNAANLMWATGFFHIPNERLLGLYVPNTGAPYFLAPHLEKENAESTWVGTVRCYAEYPGTAPAEVWMMEQVEGARMAVDSASHSAFERMRGAKPGLVLADPIGPLRYVKAAEELELTRQAAAYADFGLEIARAAVVEGLQAGITELDVVKIVQGEVTAKMQRELEDLINFYRGAVALTAHAGARGALPHGHSGPHAIRPGNTLIVGIGVKVGGYHAESGCTFVVGEPTADQLRCLEATWACDEAALAALLPGAQCSDVNEAGWAVLRAHGYGDYIRHRIGHGMGVEGHDRLLRDIRRNYNRNQWRNPLPPGMTSGCGVTDANGNATATVTRDTNGIVIVTAKANRSCGAGQTTEIINVEFGHCTIDLIFLIDVTGSTGGGASIKNGIIQTVDYLYQQLLTQDKQLRVAGIKFSDYYPQNPEVCNNFAELYDFTTDKDAFNAWVSQTGPGGDFEYQLDIMMCAKDMAQDAYPGLYMALATDEDSDSTNYTIQQVATELTQAGSVVFIDPATSSLVSYYLPLAVNGGAIEQETGNIGTFTFQHMRQVIVGQ